MIFPKKLQKGETIGIYSPSGSVISAPEETELYEKGVQALINAGYKVKEAPHARSRFYHMSATAKEKAEDIHSLFIDKEVRAIFPSVGGHTASQILPYLDLDLIKSNPKIFIGFSDSALLALYISEKIGMITFHSAVDLMFGFSRFNTIECSMQDKGNYTTKCLWNMLENAAPFKQPYSKWVSIKNGKVSGRLIGGNIKGIQALIGTPFEPDWRGKILYWEAADSPHVMAQVLAHLNNARIFDKIEGLIIGKIGHLKENFYGPDEIMPIHDFTKYLLNDKNLPIVAEADFGHDVENITIPNGCMAILQVDTESCKLTIEV